MYLLLLCASCHQYFSVRLLVGLKPGYFKFVVHCYISWAWPICQLKLQFSEIIRDWCYNDTKYFRYRFDSGTPSFTSTPVSSDFNDESDADDVDDGGEERAEEIQVGLQADAESVYLQFCGANLESIKVKRPGAPCYWCSIQKNNEIVKQLKA